MMPRLHAGGGKTGSGALAGIVGEIGASYLLDKLFARLSSSRWTFGPIPRQFSLALRLGRPVRKVARSRPCLHYGVESINGRSCLEIATSPWPASLASAPES